MPACMRCRSLVDGRCVAESRIAEVLGRPAPRLAACVLVIAEDYLGEIRRGMRVLEIGCGSWDWIKRRCDEVGARYEGIDSAPEYYGRRVVATRIENLADLSFDDESFDLVIGNQTAEHWGEHLCPLDWGLYQCFRVCKPGGRVFLNVPIHYHGTRDFLLGDIPSIRRRLAEFSTDVTLETWGFPSSPLPSIYAHSSYWTLRHSEAYVVDIRARKDKPLPRRRRSVFSWNMQLCRTLSYPLSFNLFRLARRLRLVDDEAGADEGGI